MPESERKRILEERHRLREEYGLLFDQVAEILFRHDPAGVNYETNTNEYEPEAGTILPRLRECGSAGDAQRIIREELSRWFGVDGVKRDETFETMAREVWEAWGSSGMHE